MQFCQNILNEAVELMINGQLPYADSIIIGDNASGKSELLKMYIRNSKRAVYYIDAVNRSFHIGNITSFKDRIEYKNTILEKRLQDENFNLKDTWSYYGTDSECIEFLYEYYEEKLQRLFQKFLKTGFVVYAKELQEVKYTSGDIGKLSNGYQAVVRILLELLYFDEVKPVQGSERAVVVIDEIDQYLSPKNAGRFYLFLKENFSETDFVVATHSAEVVAAASKCNILILKDLGLEILDAGDFMDIDDIMPVFKDVFGEQKNLDEYSKYDEILRRLFNNRILGVWTENEKNLYESIDKTELTKAQKVLYHQIGEW